MSDDMTELWAWVTETHDGRISLISAGLPGIGQSVLISHNRSVVLQVQHIAEAHGQALNQPVWLRRYALAEEIGRITSTLRTKQ